jgi:5-methylcytosine-specific restriction endonuclease McrA
MSCSSKTAPRRDRAYLRDALMFRGWVPCFVCGEHVEDDDATLEHIVRQADGGGNEQGNLAISHADCNRNRDHSVLTRREPKLPSWNGPMTSGLKAPFFARVLAELDGGARRDI